MLQTPLKEFIITRHSRTWLSAEYYVKAVDKGSNTERVVLHAVHKQSWKSWIDVCEVGGTAKSPLFSIKARDILALTYDVVDSEGNQIGSLAFESLFSQSWRVIDIRRDVVAQLIGVALFLCQGHALTPDGPIVCDLRDESSFFKARFGLYCCDESALNINLILSLGILLLLQGSASGGSGGA